MCGLGPDILGIHTPSVAARKRTASNSGTLADGLAKIQAAREHDHASIYAVSSEWKEKILNPSLAHGTVEEFEFVRRLDPLEKLMTLSMTRNKRLPRPCSATNAKPVSSRASKILGPVNRFRIAQIMLQNESCVTCFSLWAHCWFFTHPLHWSLYGTKISC